MTIEKLIPWIGSLAMAAILVDFVRGVFRDVAQDELVDPPSPSIPVATARFHTTRRENGET